MTKPMRTILALAAAGVAVVAPATTAAAHTSTATAGSGRCTPIRPASDFYAAGRIASVPITVPESACTTISVSRIRDVRDRTDNCQTFIVAFLSTDGTDPTYTDPVRACSATHRDRTVLAANVPDGTVFRVLYQVDYIEPEFQTVRFTVWR